LLPDKVRRAFDRVRAVGVPLSESAFGRPLLGVKSGFNDAFLVRRLGDCGELARVEATNGRQGSVEADLIRPALRGESIHRWGFERSGESIIWTHAPSGGALPRLPIQASRWLAPHRRALTARSDARNAARWWSLFRIEAAASSSPRIVWADIGRELRAAVIPAGDPIVPLNTCYVLRASQLTDALALTALLNSSIGTAWLSVIAEPARGGYRRFMGWTLALLPIPSEWIAVRDRLAELATDATAGRSISDADLNDAVARAYGIRRCDLDPLLAWTAP
jgi:hypothetical protein